MPPEQGADVVGPEVAVGDGKAPPYQLLCLGRPAGGAQNDGQINHGEERVWMFLAQLGMADFEDLTHDIHWG